MSDLFGNPEDRFSRVAAHFSAIARHSPHFLVLSQYYGESMACSRSQMPFLMNIQLHFADVDALPLKGLPKKAKLMTGLHSQDQFACRN